MSYDLNLDGIFDFHPANADTGPQHEAVRAACKNLAAELAALAPSCAERTLAIRYVQKAMHMANSAIAQFGLPYHAE